MIGFEAEDPRSYAKQGGSQGSYIRYGLFTSVVNTGETGRR